MIAKIYLTFGRFSTLFGELGFKNGLLYLVGETLRKISNNLVYIVRYYIVAQPVPFRKNLHSNGQTEIIVVDPDHPLVAFFPRPRSVIEGRYRSGSVCFAATIKNHFAGFLWLSFGYHIEDEVRCQYELTNARDCVWDFDVYVEPAFRTGRTFSRLWDAANHYLADRGVVWSLSRISAFNVMSLRSHSRLGAIQMYTATFVCCGPFQFAWFNTRPFLHLSLHSLCIPKLRLDTSKLAHPKTSELNRSV